MAQKRPRVAEEDDYYDDIPLEHKKPFGSGLKLKRVAFVTASDPDLSTTTETIVSGASVADRYLSLVMKPPQSDDGSSESPPTGESDGPSQGSSTATCPICKLPIDYDDADAGVDPKDLAAKRRRHACSIAHQASLPHSHPPSALDRSRKGLAYLEACGWDPDARKGLGAEGQGIPAPLQPKKREGELGVGAEIPKHVLHKAKAEAEREKKQKAKKLKPKEQRALDKKRDERLRKLFYEDEKVAKYLGKNYWP